MAGAAGGFSTGKPAVEPAALAIVGAAGSLVLRRVDRRGLVLAKKHGTKSAGADRHQRGLLPVNADSSTT